MKFKHIKTMKHQIKITVGNTTLLLSDAMELCKQLSPLFNGSNVETPNPQPPKAVSVVYTPRHRISNSTKAFIARVRRRTQGTSEIVRALKNVEHFARVHGIDGDCTPQVAQAVKEWVGRVKPDTVKTTAALWERQFKNIADEAPF